MLVQRARSDQTVEDWEVLIHDLRNPLAAVHGYTQLLRRRAVGRDVADMGLEEGLRHIEEAAWRLERLVDQLAAGPALRANRSQLVPPTQTDLVQLAQRMAAETPAGLSRVAVLPEVSDLVGDWDTTSLERVFGNLLDNALKYSSEDAPVVVKLWRVTGWAVMSVADRGIGIPPDELSRVFDHGYRAPNARGMAPGAGIGLAAVRHIVDGLGGAISIDSQESGGTTVTVRLPFRRNRRRSSES